MRNLWRFIFLGILVCLLASGCALNKKEDSTAARNYPFDRLGVMRQETRLGITAEEGRVISEEAFQMPPAENEIKLRYTYENGESTEAYSFVFAGQGNEEVKAVYPMGVAFRDQGTLYVGHVPALAAAAGPSMGAGRGGPVRRRLDHFNKGRLAEASPVRCNPAFHGFAGNGTGYEYHPAVRKPSNPLEFGTDPGNFNAWHTICAS